MTTTLHYVSEAVNISALFFVVVFFKLVTAELTASTVTYLDKKVIKKEH
jgi:hypothetical protein